MPYINVKVAGKLTKDQKQKISNQMSDVLLQVANKPKEHTYVVIDEVDRENWGVGSELLG